MTPEATDSPSTSSPHGTRLPKAQVDEVCASAARSANAIMTVFPSGHPVRGVVLAELGKLLCVDVEEDANDLKKLMFEKHERDLPVEQPPDSNFPAGADRLKLARESLLRARTELKLGFGGDGGEVGREVEESVRNIEKEWKGWRRVVSQGRTPVD